MTITILSSFSLSSITLIWSESAMLGFFMPGPMEMVIIGIVAVLLFGSRLPEVGRSLGKGLVEFKKGVRGIEDEIETATHSSASYSDLDDRDEATAPVFNAPAPPEDEAAEEEKPKA